MFIPVVGTGRCHRAVVRESCPRGIGGAADRWGAGGPETPPPPAVAWTSFSAAVGTWDKQKQILNLDSSTKKEKIPTLAAPNHLQKMHLEINFLIEKKRLKGTNFQSKYRPI